MKRNTPGHPKMLALAALLKIPRYQAVGIVESLWHLTAQYAKPGDIGKWSDAVIAESIGFEISEAGELVSALTEAGWLDENDEHRLVVHDWYKHAEDSVHLSLARSTQHFATGELPRMTRMAQSARETAVGAYEAQESAQKAPQERTAKALAIAFAKAKAIAGKEDEKKAHKKRTPTPPPSGAAPKSPSPPTPPPSKGTQKPSGGPQDPSGPAPVLTFPTRGKVKERPVTVAELDNLIHDFDTLDVLWELRKAERWAKAHPEKRWTVKGFDAGLNSWLTRALTPLAGKKYETAPGIKDERFARYRALFPDWDVEKVVWAMLSGEEWQERKQRRMEEAEARQEAEADAARRRDPASPEGMGSAIDGILAKAKGGDHE